MDDNTFIVQMPDDSVWKVKEKWLERVKELAEMEDGRKPYDRYSPFPEFGFDSPGDEMSNIAEYLGEFEGNASGIAILTL